MVYSQVLTFVRAYSVPLLVSSADPAVKPLTAIPTRRTALCVSEFPLHLRIRRYVHI